MGEYNILCSDNTSSVITNFFNCNCIEYISIADIGYSLFNMSKFNVLLSNEDITALKLLTPIHLIKLT